MTWIGSGTDDLEQFWFLAADSSFNQRADFFIAGFWSNDSVALQNSAGVRVHDKYRMIAGIEQNGIGSFRPHAVQGQQLRAEIGGGLSKHPVQRTGIFRVEELDKILQLAGLLPKIAGRANQLLQLRQRDITNAFYIEYSGATQIGDGLLDIRPCGVLGQERACDHFKARLRRPPVLGPPAAKQSLIVMA